MTEAEGPNAMTEESRNPYRPSESVTHAHKSAVDHPRVSIRRLAIWTLILLASAVVIALPADILWERWRANNLLAFCKEAQAGMTMPDLLRAEDRHRIDKSFIVQALFDDYIDQYHSHDLEFRSHIYDPPFACFIAHDGDRVTSVQLMETKDW